MHYMQSAESVSFCKWIPWSYIIDICSSKLSIKSLFEYYPFTFLYWLCLVFYYSSTDQQVTHFLYTYIQFSLSLHKNCTHITRFAHSTQYKVRRSLHEIVMKRIHYDSRTSYNFTKMCTSCTCHTDYRLSYNSDHFNTNFSEHCNIYTGHKVVDQCIILQMTILAYICDVAIPDRQRVISLHNNFIIT